MSLTFQFSQAVGASHAPGCSAISKSRSASLRTTRRMVSFPSYDVASHSLTAAHPSLGDLHGRFTGAGSPAPARNSAWLTSAAAAARSRKLSAADSSCQCLDPLGGRSAHRVGRPQADERVAVAHRDELADRRVGAQRRGGQSAGRAPPPPPPPPLPLPP